VTMDTAVTISVAARSDHGNGAQEIPHEVSHARP
jgi:proton glutamate symport protein